MPTESTGRPPLTPPPTSRVEGRAALLAVIVGVGLMGAKLIAYFLTGSAAIFSDALESIVNIVASGTALVVLRIAHTPPDEAHPYGHGKVEFLSAALEGGMICAAAGAIVVKAVHDLRAPEIAIEHLGIGLAITAFGGGVNALTGLHLLRLGKRTGSATLVADGRHLLSDFVTSVGAIVALLLVKLTGRPEADPILALLMAAYLALTGARLLKRSMDMLMDKQDPGDNELLESILRAHTGEEARPPRICSFHKLRHRHTGRYHWVDFHAMVPAGMTIREAHDIASEIEGEIERAMGHADATAHLEPCAGCERCVPHVALPIQGHAPQQGR